MSPLKKQLFDLEVKGQTKVIMVRDTPSYGHAPTYQISLTYLERQTSYGPDKLRWEEAEAAEEEKIRLKNMSPFVQRGEIIMAFLGGGHPELSTCEGCFPSARGKPTLTSCQIWMSTD
jgi:hypothetical protein